jgi:hypothetical protein
VGLHCGPVRVALHERRSGGLAAMQHVEPAARSLAVTLYQLLATASNCDSIPDFTLIVATTPSIATSSGCPDRTPAVDAMTTSNVRQFC